VLRVKREIMKIPALKNSRILLLFPLMLSCIYILSSSVNSEIEHAISSSIAPSILVLIILLTLVVIFTFGIINKKPRLIRTALLSICALTPFAVMYPWVATPDNIGMSYGGYRFFLEWLTKYPNFGPINSEVLLGMACVVLASFIPAVYCYGKAFEKYHRTIIVLLLLVEVAAYLPVLIRLDWLLFLGGIWGNYRSGEILIRDLSVLTGPSLRLVSFLIIFGMEFLSMADKN
jgi:hypothetical protein